MAADPKDVKKNNEKQAIASAVSAQMVGGKPPTKQNFPWNTNIRNYSINLMWINSKLTKGQLYINDSKNPNELMGQLLAPSLKWAKANPDATVNIWYDSVHIEQEALKRTRDVLSSINTNEYKNVTIYFRDIREIPIVKDNSDVFSDYLPVYFRIDLLKVIIIVDAIEREGNDAAIFSDLEVGDLRPARDRMNKEELFFPLMEGSIRFAEAGLIVNGDWSVENQFMQLQNNPKMILAIKHAIINVNLTRAIWALNFKHAKQGDCVESLSMAVICSIQHNIFPYYKAISTTDTESRLSVRPDIIEQGAENDPWISYSPDEHGYSPFGLLCSTLMGCAIIPQQNTFVDGKVIEVETVFNLPQALAVTRKVDVRMGKDHCMSASERVPKPSSSNDGIYRCKLWETKGKISTDAKINHDKATNPKQKLEGDNEKPAATSAAVTQTSFATGTSATVVGSASAITGSAPLIYMWDSQTNKSPEKGVVSDVTNQHTLNRN